MRTPIAFCVRDMEDAEAYTALMTCNSQRELTALDVVAATFAVMRTGTFNPRAAAVDR